MAVRARGKVFARLGLLLSLVLVPGCVVVHVVGHHGLRRASNGQTMVRGEPESVEMTAEAALAKRKPPVQPKHGLVTIAFDDGYTSVYEVAFPLMERFGFVATVNVISDRVPGLDPRYMHRRQLLRLQSAGWEIGSHSVYHNRPLTKMSLSDAEYELKESARQLRTLGFEINSFTYPYDLRNGALENLSRSCYQDAAAGGDVANRFPPPDPYWLKRMGVYHRMSVQYVSAQIEAAERRNSWLILFFHNISDERSAMAYPPAQFRQLLEFLRSQPVEVVTQWQGVELARAFRGTASVGKDAALREGHTDGSLDNSRRGMKIKRRVVRTASKVGMRR